MPVHNALFLSDLHIGWSVLRDHHERFFDHIARAHPDAELIVLNGDIIDDHRGLPSAEERRLRGRLEAQVNQWRAEGREVVYVEGNHDRTEVARGTLVPDRWFFDFVGRDGVRVRALHGHRVDATPFSPGRYEHYGRHFLRLENRAYAGSTTLRKLYPRSAGWVVGAVGKTEDTIWRRSFRRAVQSHRDVDVVVHGHFHFGVGTEQVGHLRLHKTGSWVSSGHLGSVDRILRYRDGVFERITLAGGAWVVPGDGR